MDYFKPSAAGVREGTQKPGELRPLFREAFPPRYRLPQDELDLRIYAAQIIGCPFLHLFQEIGWNPE
jgi:hypothetical protein